jgi:two-component system, LytTR family, response regulator
MSPVIRILILDDEQPAREALKFMLENYCPNVEIVAEATSAGEAREILKHADIDALFLDISMPGEGGFDFLKTIDSSKYMFVFVTAHDEFAIKALRASALDYLQKPMDVIELQQTVEKLVKMKNLRAQSYLASNSYNKSLENLSVNSYAKKEVKRLCLPCMQGFTVLDVNDILYLCADCNYTVFHLSNMKKIVVSKAIKDYEDLLNPSVFFRNHKSSIINLKYLKEFSKVDGYYAIMADNSSISVSRRRLPDFIRAVEEYNCATFES